MIECMIANENTARHADIHASDTDNRASAETRDLESEEPSTASKRASASEGNSSKK